MIHTFAVIKPDAVRRNLTGILLSQIEANGFQIVGMVFRDMSLYEAENLYIQHSTKDFIRVSSQPCEAAHALCCA